jgi:hypothetical protein
MLWENDGSATDIVTVLVEDVGEGTFMDRYRKKLAAEQDARKADEISLINRLAQSIHASEVVALPETGMIPDVGIPDIHYHQYAWHFRELAAKQGITLPENGYECWGCEDFMRFYRKKHPELCYKAAPRAPVITVAAKYAPINRAALAA